LIFAQKLAYSWITALITKGITVSTLKLNFFFFVSRDVVFHESVFPFSNSTSSDMFHSASPPSQTEPSIVATTTPLSLSFPPRVSISPTTRVSSPSSLPPAVPIVTLDPPVSPLTDTLAGSYISTSETLTGEDHSIALAHPRIHPMTTRAQNNIVQPRKLHDGMVRYPNARALLTVQDDALAEPTCFSNANNISEWRAAMQTEFNAIPQNKTWSLAPPTTATNVVGCKWVFKLKRKADGTIERHKASLVDKGYHQQVGLDFGETFSPVVKPTTIRTFLSVPTLLAGL